MGARPYDPSLGRFLALDSIDGGSLNNYDYAGQDPSDNYDLTGTMCKSVRKCVSAVKKAVKTAKDDALQIAQLAPYSVYYGSYQAIGALHNTYVKAAVSVVVAPGADLMARAALVRTEAAGFFGNALLDAARGKSVWDDARRDSVLPNFIASHWNPPWLQMYLPGGGTRPNGSHFIDFRH